MGTRSVLDEVEEERWRQDARWGQQGHPDFDQVLLRRQGGCTPERMAEEYGVPTEARAKFLTDVAKRGCSLTYAHILVEEVAEVVGACNGSKDELRAELLQVAAVAVAWVEKLDREREGGS